GEGFATGTTSFRARRCRVERRQIQRRHRALRWAETASPAAGDYRSVEPPGIGERRHAEAVEQAGNLRRGVGGTRIAAREHCPGFVVDGFECAEDAAGLAARGDIELVEDV